MEGRAKGKGREGPKGRDKVPLLSTSSAQTSP